MRVGDHERAATGEVWDDNWFRGSVDIDIAQPPTATLRAKCDVAWQTTELQVPGRIEAHAITTLEFEAPTDQSFLADTLAALRTVVAKYPYRG